jgi:hypothetical protein
MRRMQIRKPKLITTHPDLDRRTPSGRLLPF